MILKTSLNQTNLCSKLGMLSPTFMWTWRSMPLESCRSTYVCEQLFANIYFIKNKHHRRLTDDSLQSCVKMKVTAYSPEVQEHKSHWPSMINIFIFFHCSMKKTFYFSSWQLTAQCQLKDDGTQREDGIFGLKPVDNLSLAFFFPITTRRTQIDIEYFT